MRVHPFSLIAIAAMFFIPGACYDTSVNMTSDDWDEWGTYATPTGAYGGNQGGAQDMAWVRQQINEGIVPDSDDILPEGLFGEHRIPLSVPQCGYIFCVGAEVAAGDFVDSTEQEAVMKFGLGGFGSLPRPPLNLAAVIDTSCSMGGAPLDTVKDALELMIAGLDPTDQLAIVEFDDIAHVVLATQAVGDGSNHLAAVANLDSDGSTSIEDGYNQGLGQLRANLDPEAENRAIVFTDMQPNVGATNANSFGGLATAAAVNDNIHTTIVGSGVQFGLDISRAMSEIRGGNAFYMQLLNDEDIERVFGEDLILHLVPMAYDLSVTFDNPTGSIDIYGVPGGFTGGPMISVSTIFANRGSGGGGRGGIAFRIPLPDSPPPNELIHFDLNYTEYYGTNVHVETTAHFNGGQYQQLPEVSADGPGSLKIWALTNEYLALRQACDLHHSGNGDPIPVVQQALSMLTVAHNALVAQEADEELQMEIDLLTQLLTLL